MREFSNSLPKYLETGVIGRGDQGGMGSGFDRTARRCPCRPAPPGPASVRYSQEGMASPTTPNGAASQGSPQGFVYLPLIAGWLVPGAGHFLLRKWGRGALLAAAIIGMFAMGIAMQGKIYSSAHDILDLLGLAGDLGNGLMYIVSRAFSLGADQVTATTGDYGTRFIVVAGLLNVIAAVDAHNLRTGRKSA